MAKAPEYITVGGVRYRRVDAPPVKKTRRKSPQSNAWTAMLFVAFLILCVMTAIFLLIASVAAV